MWPTCPAPGHRPGLTSDLMVKRPTTLFLCDECYLLELMM
jgi:hypothetical protein